MSAQVQGRSGVVAALVDPVLTQPALVFGGLPPAARDLDLLLHPADRAPVLAQLAAAGFEASGAGLQRLSVEGDTVRADAADLTGPDDWDVPAEELAWLLASARPLPGYDYLLRPAPAAVLLLLAGRFGAARGNLPARQAARVHAALEEDRDAFEQPTTHARAWRCEVALSALRAAARTGRAPRALERYRLTREQQVRERETGRLAVVRAARRALLPARRRGLVLAVCGLDRSARAAQVALLLVVLADLGIVPQACAGPTGTPRELLRRRRAVRRATRAGAAVCDGSALDEAVRGRGRLAARLLPAAQLTFVLDVPDGGPLPTAYRRAAGRTGALLVAPARQGQRGRLLAGHVQALLR